MKIEFQSITLKRFRSFLEEATLHFGSAGAGLYFLKGKNDEQTALGSNGAGKSTILDALFWCLYGKTIQGLKNPDITPWSEKGTTEVAVRLLVDSERHIIKRTVSPNLLTIDGKEAGQDYVNRLIGIPLEVLPYTVLMGQRQPLFFDLTPSEKLKVFAEPLNLERWEARSAHAAELVRNLEIELSNSEQEIALRAEQLVEVGNDLTSAIAKKQNWETERESALSSKDKEKKIIEKNLAPLRKARDNADLQLDRAETELRACRPSLLKLNADMQKLERQQADAARQHNQLSAKQNEIVTQLEAIAEEGLCPLCKQPLKSHKKALQADLEKQRCELLEEIKTHQQAFKQVDAVLKKVTVAYEAEEKAQKTFQSDADEARDSLDKLLPQIADFEAKLKVIDQLKQEYENQDNPFKEQVATLRKRKSTIEIQIEETKKKLESKREYCERVRPWIKWFKDIKLYTLEEILQELEITTNSMLEEFGLIGWHVHFDIERETKSKTIAKGLNITVLSPNNKQAVKWEVWSGGEAQRLRLIGSLALGGVLLNHLGISVDLAAFDEPTESLSREGVADLVELLAAYAKDTKKHLWLVDHHAIESSLFTSVVTVVKDKSGSYLGDF